MLILASSGLNRVGCREQGNEADVKPPIRTSRNRDYNGSSGRGERQGLDDTVLVACPFVCSRAEVWEARTGGACLVEKSWDGTFENWQQRL